MPCTSLCIKSEFNPGADIGGAWTLISGPSGNTVAPLLVGDDPCIDFTVQPEGTYVFEYCGGVGACVDCAQYTFENLDTGDPGITQTIEYCDNDTTEYVLFALIGATAGTDGAYSWAGSGTVSPGYTNTGDATTDTFNPSVAGPGTYIFQLTCSPIVAAGFVQTSCCVDAVETLTIDVIAAFDAGIGSMVAVCP